MSAIATVIGFALLGDLSADEQDSLGNFLMLIGQILETVSSQKQLLEDLAQAKKMDQLTCTVESLQKQVAELQQRLPSPPTALSPQAAR